MFSFGPFLPDQADLGNPGSTVATNVLPKTAATYAPFPAQAVVSNALTNRPMGAASFKQTDGTVHTFAADSQDLFKLSGMTFGNVSRASASYTVSGNDVVNFVNFGNRVISVSGHTDPPQSFVMGTSSTFDDLLAAQATCQITISSFGDLANGEKVRLVATDQTTHDFTVGSSPGSGTFVAATSNDQTATNLKDQIDANAKFSASVASNVVTVTQATAGVRGETTVTVTDSSPVGMTATNFNTGVSYDIKPKSIAVVKDFVMMGNIKQDATVHPNRINWSAINDPTSFPTPGTSAAAAVQSDFQDLPVGGEVMAILGAVGGMDGVVMCRSAIYRLSFVGPPTVFNITEIERDRGPFARNSVVNVGPFAFYLGEEGFWSFTGAGSQSIGDQKVDRFFLNDLDQNYIDRVYGAADPTQKMVYWAYPSFGSSDGQPNKVIIYNWAVDRWSTAEVNQEYMFRNLSTEVTLEGLDAFGTVDSIDVSFDSASWIGGLTSLNGFNADKKLCRFTGPSLAAQLETQEIGGSNRIYVNAIRPYVDGGTVTVKLKHRAAPGDSVTETSENSIDADGQAHFTVSTRYARAQVNVAAGGTWSHAQGVDAEVVADGAA
tara:strand:- start:441 stop:2255 length:1815 start_codon:yes stop_codon:yes gene_type:complete